jgi:hypothetical protein
MEINITNDHITHHVMKKIYLIGLLALSFIAVRSQTISWANTGTATAWYTAGNWSSSTASGSWTTANLAQFNNTGSANTAGINMGTASLSDRCGGNVTYPNKSFDHW